MMAVAEVTHKALYFSWTLSSLARYCHVAVHYCADINPHFLLCSESHVQWYLG